VTIREAREKAGVTQFDLARRTRIHPSTLSRIESGRMRPTALELNSIAEAFGIAPEKLAEYAQVMP
jgi:transcriptional regulator with XRE-family HTH domain